MAYIFFVRHGYVAEAYRNSVRHGYGLTRGVHILCTPLVCGGSEFTCEVHLPVAYSYSVCHGYTGGKKAFNPGL
jgi:hypothetical protein